MCDCGEGYTPRQILNLPPTGPLSEKDIKKAYLKCSLKCHPDKNREHNATQMFQKISNAYNHLLENGRSAHWAPPPRQPPPPPPRQQTPPDRGASKQKFRDLLIKLSKMQYDPKISDLVSEKEFDEHFENSVRYKDETSQFLLKTKYKPLIGNFTLNPEFVEDNVEDYYARVLRDLEQYSDKEKKEQILRERQFHWLLELMRIRINPDKLYDALRHVKKPATPPEPYKGRKYAEFKDLLIHLGKIDYDPKISDLVRARELRDDFHESLLNYDKDKADMLESKYKPLFENYRLNPDFIQPQPNDNYFFGMLLKCNNENYDDKKKKERILVHLHLKWLFEYLKIGLFDELDEALSPPPRRKTSTPPPPPPPPRRKTSTPPPPPPPPRRKTSTPPPPRRKTSTPPRRKTSTPPPPPARQSTPRRSKTATPPQPKPAAAAKNQRCKKGTRRNKNTNECEVYNKNNTNARPRCPNGSRKNPKSGRCEKKKDRFFFGL